MSERKTVIETEVRTKPFWKRNWIWWMTGGVVLAFIAWNVYKKQIIRNELGRLVEKKSQGLYQVAYDSLLLDEVSGRLHAKNIRVFYDSLVFESLEKKPSMLLDIHISSLEVEGVKTPKALIHQSIDGRVVKLLQPKIKIIYTGTHTRVSPDKEIYEQILGDLKSIQLDSFLIVDARLSTSMLNDSTRRQFLIQHVDIGLKDIVVKGDEVPDSTRILFSKSVWVQCGAFDWSMSGTPYQMRADSLYLHSDPGWIYIQGFHLKPQWNEDEFAKRHTYQTDRFDFSFHDIFFNGVNMHALMNEEILVDHIEVQKADLKIYRDLNIPRDSLIRTGKYPHQQLVKVGIPLNVHRLTLKNTYVEYKEKNQRTQMKGKVHFHHTLANIHYLSNIRDSTAVHPYMDADISTRFLNKSPFNVRWRFHLFDTAGNFNIQAQLGSMPATELNSITKPMGPASVAAGQINGLNIEFKGNNHQLTGTVQFLYNKLKIEVLKKDESKGGLKKRGLATFLANIIVKNQNPTGKQDPVVVEIHEKRDINRSIFALIWKGIFNGVKQTAGM
ncbi:MAG: hypothetical protein KF880_01785 [Ferruginibacter sp.]|nr:hypothetical protein [Ferruginibacter sp.]